MEFLAPPHESHWLNLCPLEAPEEHNKTTNAKMGPNTMVHLAPDAQVMPIRAFITQWRLLPDSYGNWCAVHRRFKRWAEAGIWEQLMHHVPDPDTQEVMKVLSSNVR
jgi:hypothetical protein